VLVIVMGTQAASAARVAIKNMVAATTIDVVLARRQVAFDI
jgi:hypothetical protein